MTMENTQQKSVDSRPVEGCEPVVRRPCDAPEIAPRKGRSRVSNGSVLIEGVDGRSPWVRRCRDVIREHIADLGGADNTSAAERSIIRRAAVLTTELEQLEARFATVGEASADDLDLYQRTAGNLRRLLEAVGLQRRAKDVTPSLTEYLASLPKTDEHAAKDAADADQA
jgi:hypothetical protein